MLYGGDRVIFCYNPAFLASFMLSFVRLFVLIFVIWRSRFIIIIITAPALRSLLLSLFTHFDESRETYRPHCCSYIAQLISQSHRPDATRIENYGKFPLLLSLSHRVCGKQRACLGVFVFLYIPVARFSLIYIYSDIN